MKTLFEIDKDGNERPLFTFSSETELQQLKEKLETIEKMENKGYTYDIR